MLFVGLQQCRLCVQYDQTQNCVCALFERLRVSTNEATVDNTLCEPYPRVLRRTLFRLDSRVMAVIVQGLEEGVGVIMRVYVKCC